MTDNEKDLSNTIFLASQEVKESNVIRVTTSELRPCNSNNRDDLKLFQARLDYCEEVES